MSKNGKMELNEIVALAFHAKIGLATARKRLQQNAAGPRLSVRQLFAPTTSSNKVEPDRFTFCGRTGTLIELAYWNDTTVDSMRARLREYGVIPDDSMRNILEMDERALGPRKSINDIPGGGTWEENNLNPKGYVTAVTGSSKYAINLP